LVIAALSPHGLDHRACQGYAAVSGRELCAVVLTEREGLMTETIHDLPSPFIAVGYTDKVVFTEGHDEAPLDLRTTWQQSQGSWRAHPVFQGLPIGAVIVWLRGEDSDV